MSPADRAGVWAIVYLLITGATAYFTIFMIVVSFIRQQFWS